MNPDTIAVAIRQIELIAEHPTTCARWPVTVSGPGSSMSASGPCDCGLAAALRALSPPPPSWLPISSAPNQERVLLSDGPGGYVVAGMAWDGRIQDDEGRELTRVTLWVPLPPPPEPPGDILDELDQRIQAKFTPALNTGSAMDMLILVGEAIREVRAALPSSPPPEPEPPQFGSVSMMTYTCAPSVIRREETTEDKDQDLARSDQPQPSISAPDPRGGDRGRSLQDDRDCWHSQAHLLATELEAERGRHIPDRGRAAYAVCRCGHWETDHDPEGRCTRCPNQTHRYSFYEYLHELRQSIAEQRRVEAAPEIEKGSRDAASDQTLTEPRPNFDRDDFARLQALFVRARVRWLRESYMEMTPQAARLQADKEMTNLLYLYASQPPNPD